MSKDPDHDPSAYEAQHVHTVYEQIASHFSSTRYKPWPIIERFLLNLPPGSIGLDIGCGNGKYLAVNPNVYILGSDRSSNLVSIAKQHQPHSVLVADILDLPHREGEFDFAICVAVVHHLSSRERRVEAVRSVLEPLKGEARALIYVWALEQEGSRRGWAEGDEQDVMVPWVMKGSKKGVKQGDGKAAASDAPTEDRTFHRYYHLYRRGELESEVQAAGGHVLESGYEKDNWWAVAAKPPG
ncbi:tRNA methyltransferase, has a role in tRNA modification [Saxophila tyrrhenica]|uniref:tRNA methyltransferase, has a role in tRNA modification n=1 Tax=Saxophila tyrrhenica TaxID=1690608 RepID=A0AAV9PFI4_9PEZI|nr:tRNA methyltransferase, has a role in tRNA modification [Saxophila tyrrhenica]